MFVRGEKYFLSVCVLKTGTREVECIVKFLTGAQLANANRCQVAMISKSQQGRHVEEKRVTIVTFRVCWHRERVTDAEGFQGMHYIKRFSATVFFKFAI